MKRLLRYANILTFNLVLRTKCRHAVTLQMQINLHFKILPIAIITLGGTRVNTLSVKINLIIEYKQTTFVSTLFLSTTMKQPILPTPSLNKVKIYECTFLWEMSRNKAEDTLFWSNWVKDCSETPFSQTCTICIWLGYLQSCPFKGSMGIFAVKDQTFLYKAFSKDIPLLGKTS